LSKKTIISTAGKTGFFGLGKIEIVDEFGKIFYQHKPDDGFFNLPKGICFTNSTIFRTIKPISYKLPKLPEPDRRGTTTPTISIEPNPNTASIYLDSGKIVIDAEKWKSFGRLQREYILLHEIGHFQYDSEKNADTFAMVEMLKIGYNPSQIFTAIATTLRLNDDNLKRCKHIFNLSKRA